MKIRTCTTISTFIFIALLLALSSARVRPTAAQSEQPPDEKMRVEYAPSAPSGQNQAPVAQSTAATQSSASGDWQIECVDCPNTP